MLFLLVYTEDFISSNTATLDKETATNQIVSFVLYRQVMFWDFQQSELFKFVVYVSSKSKLVLKKGGYMNTVLHYWNALKANA